MHTLQNETLTVTIDEKGAELKSIRHRQHDLEYLWGANPAVWGKTSPVLFPIVGSLKNNEYQADGSSYSLSRHGFARDKVFEPTEPAEDRLTFTLKDSDETLRVFPFPFLFSIRYSLAQSALKVEYRVQNAGKEEMFFSVGGHPAFRVPLIDGTAYEDYFLRFEKAETAPRWPISKDGLIEKTPVRFIQDTALLPLSKTLFQKDAIVLKNLQSGFVELRSDKTPHGFRFSFSGFPYLGLWAAPNADFVCIEPWCGIADSVDADGEISKKEGIIVLPPGESFAIHWAVDFY